MNGARKASMQVCYDFDLRSEQSCTMQLIYNVTTNKHIWDDLRIHNEYIHDPHPHMNTSVGYSAAPASAPPYIQLEMPMLHQYILLPLYAVYLYSLVCIMDSIRHRNTINQNERLLQAANLLMRFFHKLTLSKYIVC